MSQYPCKILSPEEQVQRYEHNKIIEKRYRQSAKGKATRKRFNQTEKGKAIIKRYHQSEKCKASKREYVKRTSPSHPLAAKAHSVVRQATIDGKLPPLCNQRCHYCGKKAVLYHHINGYEPAHWLDVVPCCNSCNVKQDFILRNKFLNPNPQLAPVPDWMDAFERTG